MVKLIVLSMVLSLSLLFVSIAHAENTSNKGSTDTYVTQSCTGKGDKKKCKIVRKQKISDSITYLDMSSVEGEDESSLPKVSDKGKL